MAARPWEYADQARVALRVIVADPRLGLKALCSESQADSVLEDLLPEAPRERAILVMAAKAGLAQTLHDYVEQGVDAAIAINLTSTAFADTSPLDPQACHWVVTELAIALGYTTPEQQGPGDRTIADPRPAHQPTKVVTDSELGGAELVTRQAPGPAPRLAAGPRIRRGRPPARPCGRPSGAGAGKAVMISLMTSRSARTDKYSGRPGTTAWPGSGQSVTGRSYPGWTVTPGRCDRSPSAPTDT